MPARSLNQVFRLFKAGDLAAAESGCRKLVESNPGHVPSRLLMSAILHRSGQISEALRHLQHAAHLQRDNTDGLLDVARAMQRIGATGEAEELLAKLDENRMDVFLAKARNHWLRGNYDAALNLFFQAPKRWPSIPEPRDALIRGLLRTGRFDDAAVHLDRALEQFPRYTGLLELKIRLLLDRREPRQAIKALQADASSIDGDTSLMLLQSALLAIHNQTSLEIGHARPGARQARLIECFNWVQQQPGQHRWFGSSTGLLDWAADTLPVSGRIVECGVYHGLTINFLAGKLSRTIHGFDSFVGLPESWKPGESAGSYSTGGKQPITRPNVVLHTGWFEDTLPGFAEDCDESIALLHVDCDLYSSTRTVLEYLGDFLAPGSLLVFDDFLSYADYQDHEFRAAHEYFRTCPDAFELVGAVLLGRAVAFRKAQAKPDCQPSGRWPNGAIFRR